MFLVPSRRRRRQLLRPGASRSGRRRARISLREKARKRGGRPHPPRSPALRWSAERSENPWSPTCPLCLGEGSTGEAVAPPLWPRRWPWGSNAGDWRAKGGIGAFGICWNTGWLTQQVALMGALWLTQRPPVARTARTLNQAPALNTGSLLWDRWDWDGTPLGHDAYLANGFIYGDFKSAK